MIYFLRYASATLVVVFGLLIAMVTVFPKDMENLAQAMIQHEIKSQIQDELPGLGGGKLSEGFAQLSAKLQARQARLAAISEERLAGFIAHVVRGHCGCAKPGLEPTADETQLAKAFLEGSLAKTKIAQDNLSAMIRGKYDTILAALGRDVLIFFTTNLVGLMAVFVATFFKGRSASVLAVPAGALFVAIGISAWLYVFNTSWLSAILFQDYMGYWYAGYMAILFGLIMDVLVNGGRIIRWIIDAVGSVVSSVLSCF